MTLKSVNGPSQDNLVVAFYMNAAAAVSFLRDAENVNQTAEERKEKIQRALDELNCAGAHLTGAIEAVPLE